MTTTQSPLRGVLLAFLAYAVFAFSDASVKILHGAVPAYEATFLGAVMGMSALFFIKKRDDRWSDLVRTSNRWLWLLRFFCSGIGSIVSVVAFTKLPMAEAFCLLFLLPSFVTILSVIFLKEDVRWQRWAAVVIGFVGVLVVLRPGFRELQIGHVAAAVGGIVAAVSIVGVRALGPGEKLLSLYGSALLGILVIAGILMIPELVMPTAQQWIFLAGYGLLAAGGNVLSMISARMAPANLVAPPQYSQMIWAIGFGYFVFDDTVDLPMAFGIVLIVGSGLLTLIRERKRGTALPTPVLSTDNQAVLATTEVASESH